MKKLIRVLLVTVFLLTALSAYAENFCVDSGDTWNSSACSSDCSAEIGAGTCMDIDDVATSGNWASSDTANKIDAGDTVYFSDSGGDFVVTSIIQLPQSGSSGSPITLTNYSGDSPTISARGSISGWDTGGNWTDEGSNVWSFSLSIRPHRVFIDSTEYVVAEELASISSTYRWFYSDSLETLSVYSTSNPASNYTNVEAGNNSGHDTGGIFEMYSKGYITIDGLSFEGSYSPIVIRGSNNIIVQNCNIGLYSMGGIWLVVHTTNECSDIDINSNIIASGWNFPLTDYFASDGRNLLEDGINVQAGDAAINIYKNTISDWGHSGFGIRPLAGYPLNNLNFYENEVEGDGSHYCRGFGINGDVADALNVNIYHNYFHDLNVKCNLAMSNVSIYSNVFKDTTTTPGKVGASQGLGISLYSTYSAESNLIYNNTFKNIAGACIRLYDQDTQATNDMENNLIKNNIFENCGNDSASYPNIAVLIENDSDVLNNTFQNNVLYKSGQTDLVNYRGNTYTISEFEANTTNGDVASNNISGDPKTKSDGTLLPRSSAIDAGVLLSIHVEGWQDYAGTKRLYGDGPDIGAYEKLQGRTSFPLFFPLGLSPKFSDWYTP